MKLVLIVLFYISTLGWAWGDSLAAKNKEGNRLYREGKVDEALSKWRDAQIENPDNDKLHYNIGNGLHEQKKYEDAFNEYEKSLNPDVGGGLKPATTEDSELQKNAYYNMGNTHYRMGKLQEAIEDYKKCLDIDPNDEDAKYNIEFVRKKIKEEKEGQAQKEKEAGEEEDKEVASNRSQEAGKEEQAKEEPQITQIEKQDYTDKQKKDQMSKEDALRLLDALKDDEKDLQKELRNQAIEGEYKVEKDW